MIFRTSEKPEEIDLAAKDGEVPLFLCDTHDKLESHLETAYLEGFVCMYS